MRSGRSALLAALLIAACLPAIVSTLQANPGNVASTVHNLSVSGPGQVRALGETEICKFCHIPHNPVVPVPLWGHVLSRAQYQVPQVSTMSGARTPVGQPDGSSRLCLSCHDGTVALGEIAGEPRSVAMLGATRLTAGHRGFIGTDLSGSHPISFTVPDGDVGTVDGASDMGLRPLSVIQADPEIALDDQGKMQCTTCHDPHSDLYYQPGRVPRFWVKPTVGEVCLTCHAPR
jgi:hypothetical protein